MKEANEREEAKTKMQSKIKQLTNELNQQKTMTKEKDKEIMKMVNDINKYVQKKDEKDYVAGLMKLNQDYVNPRGKQIARSSGDDP